MGVKNVVITGIGLITPNGFGLKTNWEKIINGNSGIGQIKRFNTHGNETTIAGEIDDKELDIKAINSIDTKIYKRSCDVTRLGIVAALYALDDAGIKPRTESTDKLGIIVGNADAMRAFHETLIHEWIHYNRDKQISEFPVGKTTVLRIMQSSIASQIAMQLGSHGPAIVVNTACSSGLTAISQAYDQIRAGVSDIFIAGGIELMVTKQNITAFNELGALTTKNDLGEKAIRPFDIERAGMLLSDGAALLVLESEEHAKMRGADIYGKIGGYGIYTESYNIAMPDPTGKGMANSMIMALKNSEITPSQIDYISAHGTSTVINDIAETRAIKIAFNDHAKSVAISSPKSMIGHTVAAAGAIQVAFSLLSMKYGIIPPTINLEHPDPQCDLFYTPNCAIRKKVKTALVNTFALGGINASMVLQSVKE